MSEAEHQANSNSRSERFAAWAWIPSLYLTSGLPNVVVTRTAAVMYENLGVGVDKAAAYCSDLMFPWVIKPLWSPLVDVLGTQRRWIVVSQAVLAVATMTVAFGAQSPNYVVATLAGLWLMAIASATHDIAADGFYMSGLTETNQAWFVGIRNSLYRVAMVVGFGGVVWMSGRMIDHWGYSIPTAWSWVLGGIAVFFAVVAAYHQFALPRQDSPNKDHTPTVAGLLSEFAETFITFFQKPGIFLVLAYLLLYRFSEAQLGAVKPFFLLAGREEGGLGLDNELIGKLDGGLGVVLLLIGGVLGGIVVSRDGLRRWLFPMALAINLPNACYAYLAATQPESLWLIGAAIGIEAFGYGFGFAGYMLYMLLVSRGKHQTAHYALCTGFMALGVQLPGRFSGVIAKELGYENFFYWVLIAMIPSLVMTLIAPLSAFEHNTKEAHE